MKVMIQGYDSGPGNHRLIIPALGLALLVAIAMMISACGVDQDKGGDRKSVV